jgi:hypothetical protein
MHYLVDQGPYLELKSKTELFFKSCLLFLVNGMVIKLYTCISRLNYNRMTDIL